MYRGSRILGVIPARGGSKGVPRKNIRLLNGRPLITYAIDQAKAVPELDTVVVSTEDEEIARVARTHGTRIIDRPPELATDCARTEGVLLHALDILSGEGEEFEYIVLLEPTSPLRSVDTIRGCIASLINLQGDALVTVKETRENIGTLEDGLFRPLGIQTARRRQERRPYYVECGTVYIVRVDHLRRTGNIFSEKWIGYAVSQDESEDINSLIDFQRVEGLMRLEEIRV